VINTDNKIIAILVVVILAAAGGVTYYVLSQNHDSDYKDGAYQVISRVNTEGSGIYIKSSIVTDSDSDGIPERNGTEFYSLDGSHVVIAEANKDAWKGLTLGTPGPQSIQHIQMLGIVKDNLGLQFTAVSKKGETDPNQCVYYNDTISSANALDTAGKANIDGGIVWEPQVQVIIADTYQVLCLTNNLFEDHTCCTIIGSYKFLQDNSDVTVRFLAAYKQAVDFINGALADTTSADYTWLVELCSTKVPAASTTQAEAALANITYVYADGADGNLNALKTDIANLATSLKALGALTQELKDATALSNKMVNDTYMKQAVSYTYSDSPERNVRVAVIDGDIHQIAIHVAVAKGYFTDNNLTVTVSNGLSAGGPVADAVIRGQADYGFLGAPPATLKTINGQLIKV